MKKVYVLTLAICMLLVGCGGVSESGEPEATDTTKVTQPLTTGSEKVTSGDDVVDEPVASTEVEPSRESVPAFESSFEESPCPFDVPAGAAVKCGYIEVPQDHNSPTSETFRLAVAVFHDQSADHQEDPVILLTGGPGEKVMHNAGQVAALFGHVHPKRDFIIFDQRGVGLSEPALECPAWVQSLYDVLDEPDPIRAMSLPFDALMQCRDEFVEDGIDLSAFNSQQSAADVDAIRRALGYEQFNLLGGSYGSFLAQAVARAYPDTVRSMVINSVWPLEENFIVSSPLVWEQAALDMLAACEDDPECSQAYPDLQEVLFEVMERLNETPAEIKVVHALTGEEFDVLLTGDRVFSNLVGFLYQTQMIQMLPEAIYDVYNGDYDLMARLQGVHMTLYEALSRGMTYSVLCAEDLIGTTPEDLMANIEAMTVPDSEEVDLETAMEYSIYAICEAWPVEELDPSFKEPLVSDIPSLLLEGELDPVTPTEFAHEVNEHLSDSYLYEFPGVGHDVLVATDCSRQIIGDFIDDPGKAPDAACTADLGTGFSIQYDDPQGLYSLPLPPGWIVEEEQEYLSFSSPDGVVEAAVVVIEGEDIKHAAEEAWQQVVPNFDAQPNVVERPCVGCAAADADRFALLFYQPGGNEFALASVWVHEGKSYLILCQTEEDALAGKGPQIDAVIMGFEIRAMD
ncbi:MAG: alpha/beta fold hydrolase [Chloroflexota bacterium]|nr:alpha/beta fold hydrolase [Chloroflexota bacterium]